MKLLITFFAVITSIISYGQTNHKYPHEKWTPDDFKQHDIRKLEAYSYKVKKNGKLKSEPALLHRFILDTLNNSVHGVYTVHTISSHGPETWQLYNFTNIYDKKGKIIHTEESPLDGDRISKRHFTDITLYKSQTNYDYDASGNLIKKVYSYITENSTIFSEDTISQNSSSSPITNEYVYKNNRQIAEYYSKDSTTTKFISKGIVDIESKSSYSYEPRYKDKEWIYNETGDKKTCKSYTREGKLHTTYNYFYDPKHRITKEIDSTGWYINGKRSYLKKLITYEYGNEGKKVHILTYDDFKNEISDREEERYDQKNRLISTLIHNSYFSMGTDYVYEGENLIKKANSYNNRNTSEAIYIYNNRGLMIEQRVYYKNKLNEVIKYYYE